jgi:uncharacterized SAM-binding protein YcdF (DUF218 family)
MWAFSLFFVSALLLYIWLGYKISSHEQSTANGKYDTLIILGAKVKENGTVSLSLKNRLDVAYEYLIKYPHVQAVVTGGQGTDEPQTEASAMYTYLVNKGIEPERILLEDKSTSTYENLVFTKQVFNQSLTEATIVSNDFHLARAKFLANELNLEVDLLSAKTPQVVETKSRIRERAALLKTYIFGK